MAYIFKMAAILYLNSSLLYENISYDDSKFKIIESSQVCSSTEIRQNKIVLYVSIIMVNTHVITIDYFLLVFGQNQ